MPYGQRTEKHNLLQKSCLITVYNIFWRKKYWKENENDNQWLEIGDMYFKTDCKPKRVRGIHCPKSNECSISFDIKT